MVQRKDAPAGWFRARWGLGMIYWGMGELVVIKVICLAAVRLMAGDRALVAADGAVRRGCHAMQARSRRGIELEN
jgi:hypothetical protein